MGRASGDATSGEWKNCFYIRAIEDNQIYMNMKRRIPLLAALGFAAALATMRSASAAERSSPNPEATRRNELLPGVIDQFTPIEIGQVN